MAYGLPAHDEPNWDIKLVASVDAVKATADAATTAAAAAQSTANTAVSNAATAQGGADASAKKASNLADLANAATARSNLGLGDAATKNSGVASGVADLDSGGKLPEARIPARLSDATLSATYGLTGRATQPTNSEKFWLSTRVADLRAPQGVGDRRNVLAPALSWEGAGVQEPSVFFANGVWNMLYTGSLTAPGIGWATANSPEGPWTKQGTGPVVGQGAGGVSGTANHGNVYIEGSTAYLFFVGASSTTLSLATASLSNLSSWTLNAKTWPLPAGTQWGNTCIVKEADNTYTMFFEVFQTQWRIGVGTLGSSLTNNLTVQTNPLTSLYIGSAASSSNPQVFIEAGKYVMYFHAGIYGSLPTDIYRATSTDKTNWTLDNNGQPIIPRLRGNEVDQVADVSLAQTSDGDWWAVYTAADNPNGHFYINAVPLLPTLRRLNTTAGTYDRVESVGPIQAPSGPQIAVLTTDKSTSSTTYVDVGLQVDFVPKSTRALVDLRLVASNGGSSQATYFQIVCPNNGAVKKAGQITASLAGGQEVGGATVMIGNLTPGQAQQFKVQWKVSGNTAQCRPATLPDQELMSIKAEDAGQPISPYNT